MFRPLYPSYILKYYGKILVCQPARTYAARNTMAQRYRSQFYPQYPEAPYNFICQIGDPVLRRKCEKMDERFIDTPVFQDLIAHMWKVKTDYECAGLSAPQIGLPLQLVLIGVSEENIEGKMSPLLSAVPDRVLINPVIKVINYNSKITAPEVCASVCSFSASVTRYTDIRVEALNEKGVKMTWDAHGFEARVIQHEIDHLAGTVYVDKMEPKTFQCTAWQHINASKGKSSISYGPRKRSIFDHLKLLKKL